ncbi:LysR family transcriptional regulator [Ensifer sp. SL37]|uniref:LysR family transcriptional regulator n=1 Tax=Ensifer sp. SL37 TaxID=2995137 RepID=UPI0022744A58|nr:LysR family transcriptional regulator [Ensifer sp. SL37]MCY1746113.1 LysR family transcriptional regulator [Ensifer sp. SL37]
MNWNDVRYFLAVTRQGGLTGAAREVKASASTVARRIETLEYALKTRLFERRPDGYKLTDAGRAMVEKATAIETAMRELEGSFCGQDGRVSGAVRIITVDTLAHHLLMPNLPALQEAYPDLSLGVSVNATSFAQIPQRETDIGLRLCRPEQGNYVVRRIGTIAFGLYASKAYLESHPVRENKLPITGHRLITWGDPLSFLVVPKTLRSWVESGIANLTVDTMQAQVLAMKAGNGLGVLPCILADTEDELVRVKPDLCRQEEAIWLVVHEGVRDTKRIRVVGDFLETIVKQGQRALSGRFSEQLQVK